jgi:tol-pal system protein YbgF
MSKLRTIMLAGAAVLMASAAGAQNATLSPRLNADELQAQFVRHPAASRAGDVQVAQLFGESDEEKKARLLHEQNQDSQITDLNNRVGDLVSTVTRLTGQIEQLDHRLAEANARTRQMQKDYDYKLCTMAAQQLGASTNANDPNALPCAGGSDQGAAPQPQSYVPPPSQGYAPSVTATIPPPSTPMDQANATPTVHLAPPPGVLGTLPAAPQRAMSPPPGGIETGMLPSVDVPSKYESAMTLLSQAQYDEARAQFRSFADANPQDPMAAQAVYWVANISFVQKDYPNASRSFAEELKKYPTSPRAPESMLKLGQSLIAMNQKKEGCTFLGALHAKYPAAAKPIVEQTLAARKAAGCR